jgi:hypothetical protein
MDFHTYHMNHSQIKQNFALMLQFQLKNVDSCPVLKNSQMGVIMKNEAKRLLVEKKRMAIVTA